MTNFVPQTEQDGITPSTPKMRDEKEKMLAGELYDANYDPTLLAERKACMTVLHEINSLSPSDDDKRYELFREILGNVKDRFIIESPFHCDYGYNIELGENFYMNVNCVILDEAKVTFGDNVIHRTQLRFLYCRASF